MYCSAVSSDFVDDSWKVFAQNDRGNDDGDSQPSRPE